MAIRKKIVFLPYDMDTALGINNEGELVFSYNLEDIDHLQSGANVFNGQDSVLWKNLRATFDDDIRTMYQNLRSSGVLSYNIVEGAFENHQNQWGEAIFNEDAWFKYLAPLIEDNNGAYLSMLQGSKAEQRKWWLFNRFRYIDSKYNAGDALTDYITVRGYAPADITVTPYADIYAAIKFGSTLVQGRAPRNIPYTLECPLDNVNDTETMIFSASQLKSIGDLAPYKIGFGDFRAGTKLQSIKVGDADSEYSNGNLNSLMIGNNTLLKTLDVRNCPNLSGGIDISHCTNIEHIYFDGTGISGLSLPDGGFVKTLHLPDTVTNLTILNQKLITDFKLDDRSNISTLRLENVSDAVDSKEIISEIGSGSRVRLIGFTWECSSASEIRTLYDKLDTMRGLSENNDTLQNAVVAGAINIDYISEAQYIQLSSRYLDVEIRYQHMTEDLFTVTWCANDGSVLRTSYYRYGDTPAYPGSLPPNADPDSPDQTFIQWKPNLSPVTQDITYTASYVPIYTVTFKNGNTTLLTVQNVERGSSVIFTGNTPTKTNYDFLRWDPQPVNIQGDTTCNAIFVFSNLPETITDSWDEIIESVENGTCFYKYRIGDTKKMIFDDFMLSMELVGFNVDELEDGTSVASTSWLSKQVPNLTVRWNNSQGTSADGTGNVGGWEKSYLRSYMINNIKPRIPQNVRNKIKTVKKYHRTLLNGTYTYQVTLDDVWVPSLRDLGNTGTETQGGMYYFSTAEERKKLLATENGISRNTYVKYWTRSAITTNNQAYYIEADGSWGWQQSTVTQFYNFPIGFCL